MSNNEIKTIGDVVIAKEDIAKGQIVTAQRIQEVEEGMKNIIETMGNANVKFTDSFVDVYVQGRKIDSAVASHFWYMGEAKAKKEIEDGILKYDEDPILPGDAMTVATYFVMYMLGYEYVKRQPDLFYQTLYHVAFKYAMFDLDHNLHNPIIDKDNVLRDYINLDTRRIFYDSYNLNYHRKTLMRLARKPLL